MADPVVVVGAGPAGLSAALAAATMGADVVIVDSAGSLGGQLYRQSAVAAPTSTPSAGAELIAQVAGHPRVQTRLGVEVVRGVRHATGVTVLLRGDGGLSRLTGAALVIASGASELALPFPGWELPGVMTPGAAQAMLKAHQVRPGNRVVVGGTGPFLWPVAAALVTAGVDLAAVVEAVSRRQLARRSFSLGRHGGIVAQAAGYLATVVRAGVPVLWGHAVVAAKGDESLCSVVVDRLDGGGYPVAGRRREIEVDALCVGWGFIPVLDLARSLGCAERLHPTKPFAVVAVDDRQATSTPTVFAAGEVTGIGGGPLAAAEGTIAGIAAAAAAGESVKPDDVRSAQRQRRRLAHAAAVLDRAYPVPVGWTTRLADDTVFCRCEEVTWGQIRAAVAAGFDTARGVKGQVRCGMGWCQGRVCGPAVQSAIAAHTGRSLAAAGELGGGPLAVPVSVAELAGLEPGPLPGE